MNPTPEDPNAEIEEMEGIHRALYGLCVSALEANEDTADALMWAADQAWNELQALYAQRRALLDAAAREED